MLKSQKQADSESNNSGSAWKYFLRVANIEMKSWALFQFCS